MGRVTRLVAERRRQAKRRASWTLGPCRMCGGSVYYRTTTRDGRVAQGAPVCSTCHPPADPEIVEAVRLARSVGPTGADPTVVVVGRPAPQPEGKVVDHGPNPFQ